MKLWGVFTYVWQTLRGIGSKNTTKVPTISTQMTSTGYNKYNIAPSGFDPKWIIIHHSLSPDGKERDWNGIRKYHMSYRYKGDIITEERYEELQAEGKTSGLETPWKDIGYHLGIEEVSGRLEIQKGRPIGTPGAHAIGFNDNSIGLCLIGHYDQRPPSEPRLFLLGSVCRDLQRLFVIAPDHVIGHRETFSLRGVPIEKSCPGSAFNLDAFRKRLI